jgi:hypothetical protein
LDDFSLKYFYLHAITDIINLRSSAVKKREFIDRR